MITKIIFLFVLTISSIICTILYTYYKRLENNSFDSTRGMAATIITNMLAYHSHISYDYRTPCTNMKYKTKQTVVVKKNGHCSMRFAYLYYRPPFVCLKKCRENNTNTLRHTQALTNTPTLLKLQHTSCFQEAVLHRSLQTTCHNNHLLMHPIFKRDVGPYTKLQKPK